MRTLPHPLAHRPLAPSGAVALALALAACATATPIAALGDNTYAVTLTAAESGPVLRQRAVDTGQTQCIQNSRYFYIVSENSQPAPNGTSLTLTFKCLRGDDPLMHKPDTFKSN